MPEKTLIISTSGVRGIVGSGLDPTVATNFAAAFGTFLKRGTVVVGRDSRSSGEMLKKAVISGLQATGINVIDIGIVPTPTVEIAVKELKAAGGICITASHNPAIWNALKFFNRRGEFAKSEQFDKIEKLYESQNFSFVPFNKIGKVKTQTDWVGKHIKKTLALKAVRKSAIAGRKFIIVVDAINGAGSLALPDLLEKLGAKVFCINCNSDGNFVHGAEPVPKNLKQLGREVLKRKADIGLATDPDADRLAIVDEKGQPIGEELTLAIAVREITRRFKGPIVINISTSKVTADEAVKSGSRVYYSKVGEANVVQMMQKKKAVIGGEGNGGVIYPTFHAGRDALVAAALVLSCLAGEKRKVSDLVETLSRYYTIKSKAKQPANFDKNLKSFGKEVKDFVTNPRISKLDGLRVDFSEGWFLVRKSKTEPIFRLMVETNNAKFSRELTKKVMKYFVK
ncbi:MAG: phosphoglucosamine mutase [candidate division Zixibacteria bacterium]|nr:phosphoglucosamine mutase [candidate division Zixibacteria bacterium]